MGEEVVQPFADVNLCQFAASHEGVDDGSILGSIVVATEQTVLTSLKSWPKEYIDGFIPKDFRVQRTFLDELARMISIHVTANFLSKPHKEAASFWCFVGSVAAHPCPR